MSLTKVSQLEWDIAYNTLSEEQRSRVLELALRIMPSEPPEPGDLEVLREYAQLGERFSFSSAKEIADYFGIPE
jgi:hypothetical protein